MELKNCILRVLDTETTGVEDSDHIIELAFIDFTLTEKSKTFYTANTTREYSELIKPPISIPPLASAVHHITDRHVADAKPFADIAADVGEFTRPIGDVLVNVAHNAEFDARFWPSSKPWLCTYRLAKHLFPDYESYSNQYIRFKNELIVPGAEGKMAHRALADVEVTAANLFEVILPELFNSTDFTWESEVEDIIKWANGPVRLKTINFGKHRGQAFDDLPTSYLSWMLTKGTDFDADVIHTAKLVMQTRRGRNAQ